MTLFVNQDDEPTGLSFAIAGIVVVAFGLCLFFGGMWGWKSFKVWSKSQDGKAELAEAEFSKQIQLEEAKANLEAEKLNAQAEVQRAKGAAEAIKIEGGQLTENYIRYLWIRNLGDVDEGTIIYVPTEGGLPILEAGRSVDNTSVEVD